MRDVELFVEVTKVLVSYSLSHLKMKDSTTFTGLLAIHEASMAGVI